MANMLKEKATFNFNNGKLTSVIQYFCGRIYVTNENDFSSRLSYFMCDPGRTLNETDFWTWKDGSRHISSLHQFVRGLVGLPIHADVESYTQAVRRDKEAQEWLKALRAYHVQSEAFWNKHCPLGENQLEKINNLSKQELGTDFTSKKFVDISHARSIMSSRLQKRSLSTQEVHQI